MSDETKHLKFASEPMGDKKVEQLPGIDAPLHQRLIKQGVGEASSLLGKFLSMRRDEDVFSRWLVEMGADATQAGLCCACLREWCENFL